MKVKSHESDSVIEIRLQHNVFQLKVHSTNDTVWEMWEILN